MKERKRISTEGEPIAWASPFAALKNAGLPLAPEAQPEAAPHNTIPLARKRTVGEWISFARPHIVAARP